MKESIYIFFEHPRGFLAHFFQVVIFLLIIISVVMLAIEFAYPHLFLKYVSEFRTTNYVIVGVFTFEYLIRLITAPNRLQFIRKPLSIVDFLATAPNYIEFLLPIFINTTTLRAIRLIRLLRFIRTLRVLRLLRYGHLFKKALHFQETILEVIIPVIIFFGTVKAVIWFLESEGWWIPNTNLGELFTIIGFALGIILSQKIGVSYDKFLQVGAAIIRLYATLKTLILILDQFKPKLGTIVIKNWTKTFLTLLHHPNSDNYALDIANKKLYQAVLKAEPVPGYVTSFYLNVCQDAVFCLSKKVRLTPKAYDILLHQATMVYFLLITFFIPGFTGLISVVVATYMLFGMYYLTQDLDTIAGGEYNLININTSELEHLVKS